MLVGVLYISFWWCRDNSDEDKLLETLKSFNVLSENFENLVNIATKDIATDDIQESLLNAEKGERS